MTAFEYYQKSENGIWGGVNTSGNRIIFPSESLSDHAIDNLKKITIGIVGNDNCIVFKNLNGNINREVGIWISNQSNVTIGAFKSLVRVWITASFGSSVEIGDDVVFAQDVTVFCGNFHKLFDYDGRCRNKNKIVIGDHVWIGLDVKVLAGANIGSGSIIGAGAVVAGKIPNNVTAAGNPAKVISKDVFWCFPHSCDNETNFFDAPDYMQKSINLKYRKKTEE